MFVYNLKVNGNIVFKVILFSIIIVALIILILSVFNIYSKSNFNSDICVPTSSIANISANQYTNILKEVYDNPDNYVGQSINFTGYVYRLSDMNSRASRSSSKSESFVKALTLKRIVPAGKVFRKRCAVGAH